jgi:putative heme-binding domain-containing protein
VAALYALAQLGGAEPTGLSDLLALGRVPALRVHALAALGSKAGTPAAGQVPDGPFVAALRDPDPSVRLAGVTGLGRLGRARAARSLLPLVADTDPVVAHVALNTLVLLRASGPALRALATPSLATRLAALRVLRRLPEVPVVDALVARLGHVGRTPGNAARARSMAAPAETERRALLTALCRLAYVDGPYQGKWWGTRPDTSGPVYDPAPWAGTPRIEAALRAALEASEGDEARWLVAELGRHRVSFPGLAAVALARAGGDTVARLGTLESLMRGDGSIPGEGLDALATIAGDDGQPPELRARALRLVHRAATRPEALPLALAAFAPFATQRIGEAPVRAAFEDFTRDLEHGRHLRQLEQAVVDADADRRALAQTILVNLASGTLGEKRVRDAAARALAPAWTNKDAAVSLLAVIGRAHAIRFADEVKAHLKDAQATVAEAAEYALTELGLDKPGAGPRRLIEAIPFAETVALARGAKGDVEVGRALFLRQGCLACHTTAADEPPKGPFLGGIAARYSRPELIESILKPGARIAQGFESQWFKTKAGEQLDGFVTREAADEVELRNPAGVVTVLKKQDLAGRGKREASMMPEGLVNDLTPEELASLLAFLEATRDK